MLNDVVLPPVLAAVAGATLFILLVIAYQLGKLRGADYPPQKAALEDVLTWLRALGIPDSELYVIQRFATMNDLRNWMQAQQEVTR